MRAQSTKLTWKDVFCGLLRGICTEELTHSYNWWSRIIAMDFKRFSELPGICWEQPYQKVPLSSTAGVKVNELKLVKLILPN